MSGSYQRLCSAMAALAAAVAAASSDSGRCRRPEGHTEYPTAGSLRSSMFRTPTRTARQRRVSPMAAAKRATSAVAGVDVRDSTAPDAGMLSFAPAAWAALISSAKQPR
ncbi:DUF397 domain-containing protein [Micromonospora sp. CA-248212]|uniref:DUF397 domain-containing protein n=1 Tax=Micromonospora sp. CA-248212 TaxID=3239961 RepID=UPI003D8B6434